MFDFWSIRAIRSMARLACILALPVFSSALYAQLTPSTNQAQDPVVTDTPSHIRGVPSIQNESFANLNNLMQLYSLARIDKGARDRRVYYILRGSEETSDPRLKPLLEPASATDTPCDGQHALLLHLAVWHVEPASISDGKTPRTFALAQSEWHGFLLKPKAPKSNGDPFDQWPCKLVETEREDGTPSFYRGTQIYFVGANAFDSLFYGFRVSIDYKLDTIGLVPQNIADLAAGISAISGVQITPNTPAATQITPPGNIDTGADSPVPLALATILMNVYQGRVNETLSASAIDPAAPRPYSLNGTFFLQFAPSLLTLTQGQILQNPSAPIQTKAESTTPNPTDTTVHLKERLEIVADGYDITALGPLPPVLSFTSDLAQEEQTLRAGIAQNSSQNPSSAITVADETAHIDAILARDYEAIATIESSKSVALVNAIHAMREFARKDCKKVHNQDTCDPYFQGDPKLPDELAKNFKTSINFLEKQVQAEADHYLKEISPAYQGLAQSLATEEAALIAARNIVRDAAQLGQEAHGQASCPAAALETATTATLSTANDFASSLDCILQEKATLSENATRFAEHYGALGKLCGDEPNAETMPDECKTPIQAAEQGASCDAYDQRTSDSNLHNASLQVAVCREHSLAAAGVLEDLVKNFQNSKPNSLAANAQTAIAKAQAAVGSGDLLLTQIQISNALMAGARNDAIAAEKEVDDQSDTFSSLYNRVFSQGDKQPRGQKRKQATLTDKEPQKTGATRFAALAPLLFQGSSEATSKNTGGQPVDREQQARDTLTRVGYLVGRITHARQAIDETETALTKQEPPAPVQPSSCGCCCCATGTSCSNNAAAPPSKPASDTSTSAQAHTTGLNARSSPVQTENQRAQTTYLGKASMATTDQLKADISPNARNATATSNASQVDSLPLSSKNEKIIQNQGKIFQSVADSSNSAASPPQDIGTAFLTSSTTGGSISGIPFRAGDFPLIMIVDAAENLQAIGKHVPACLAPKDIYDDEEKCLDEIRQNANANADTNITGPKCEKFGSEVPCFQFVALTTSASSPSGASMGAGGAQSLGGGGKAQGAGGGGAASVAQSPTQAVDCSRQSSTSGPCAFARSYTVDRPQFWDVSLGLSTPGVAENIYTVSSTATATPTCPTGYTCSLKHHEDAYAFVDWYPFATYWFTKRPWFSANSYLPHINAGIPITSQSFHRPYVGVAERFSQVLEHRLGLPLPLSVYGGIVFMQQTICDSTACLTNVSTSNPQILPVTDRALKPTFGVEVSISAIAGKLSKGGGASKTGGSTSSSGSGSSGN
jgi:hypothetical protein